MERDGTWIEDTTGIAHLAREGPDGPEKDDANLVSLVIPIFNEERSIVPLCGEIADVSIGLQHSFEVNFVEDGSSDGSWEVLRDLARMEPSIKAIRLRRSYGQTAAMMAGIDAARGSAIVPTDGDGQNDPADIPRILDELSEGYDVVSGWRGDRQDKASNVRLIRVANFQEKTVSNGPKSNPNPWLVTGTLRSNQMFHPVPVEFR